MDTISLDLLVDKKEIMFISAVFESYDGIAFFRTIDSSIGHVFLMVSPSFVREADSVLKNLRQSVNIRPLYEEKALKSGFHFFDRSL